MGGLQDTCIGGGAQVGSCNKRGTGCASPSQSHLVLPSELTSPPLRIPPGPQTIYPPGHRLGSWMADSHASQRTAQRQLLLSEWALGGPNGSPSRNFRENWCNRLISTIHGPLQVGVWPGVRQACVGGVATHDFTDGCRDNEFLPLQQQLSLPSVIVVLASCVSQTSRPLRVRYCRHQDTLETLRLVYHVATAST